MRSDEATRRAAGLRRIRATPDTFRFREYAERFLSSEDACIHPREGTNFSMLIVYPNQYQLGMSNLGFQSIYRLVNSISDWSCERAFFHPAPWGAELRSLESARRGNSYHIVGFSCSYELDYPNVVAQIRSTGVALRAEERGEGDPVFVLGGAVTFFNPLPLAPFFDVVVLGEAEPVLEELLSRIAHGWGRLSRWKLLERLAQLEGVWCPPLEPVPGEKVRLEWRAEDSSPEFSCIVSREAHMGDMFLVEVGRGCGRRCRFCVASHVYWPLRMWPVERILTTVDEHRGRRSRVGLVGAALSDYPWLGELLSGLVERGLGVGLSSLRIDTLDESLVALLDEAGVRSVALAPETASARMQAVIHKNLKIDRMLAAADALARSNVEHVKLYFLIGLPFERDEDIEESARFTLEFARRLRALDRRKRLTVSVNAFIPKPHTPFQWCGMAPEDVLRRRRQKFREYLKREGRVELDAKGTRGELLQAALSLGDLRTARALEVMVEEGVSPKQAFRKAGIAVDKEVHEDKPEDCAFPWEFLRGGPGREVLLKQYRLARESAVLL